MKKKVLIFSTRSSKNLAEKISFFYGEKLGKVNFLQFADGEYELFFEESIRGSSIFLISSTFPPVDNLIELLLMCDAAHRASAKEIILVIPYFGWARQDRKNKPRGSIGAKLMSNIMMISGATQIITVDLHSDQIQGFFEIPIDNLCSSNIFIKYIKKLNLNNLTIASPDMGGSKRAKNYANFLNANIAICYKERKKANEIEYMNLIGKVKNKNVILVDDIVDTGETLVMAANLIKKEGAISVSAIATHPLLSSNAYEKIINSSLKELVVTDSIPLKKDNLSKIKVLSCAPLLADIMHLVYNDKSINNKFIV